MKKLYLFMIVIMLVSPLLMAAGGNAIKISGYITAIDDDNMTIIVNDTLLVQVTDSTTIYESTGAGSQDCEPITFEDLNVGDRVRVIGQYSGDELVAKRIIVH